MRILLASNRVALVAFVLVVALSFSSSWPHNHRNKHNQLHREALGLLARSGSSLSSNTIASISAPIIASSHPAITALDEVSGIGSYPSMRNSHSGPSATPVTQIHFNPTELRTPIHTQAAQPQNYHGHHYHRVVNTSTFYLTDMSATVVVTKPSCIHETIPALRASSTSASKERGSNARLASYAGPGSFTDHSTENAIIRPRFPATAMVASNSASSSITFFDSGYQSFQLGDASRPPTVSSSSPAPGGTTSALCPAGNGTTYTSSGGKQYQIICNINIPAQDYPFQLVSNFDDCVAQCDSINARTGDNKCLAALFIRSRMAYADDCYLKYSIENPTPVNHKIDGAILLTDIPFYPSSSTQTVSTSHSSVFLQSSTASSLLSTSTVSAGNPLISYAADKSVITPKVAQTHLHGQTQNHPTKQYMDWKPPTNPTLATHLLSVGVNGNLSTGYELSLDTGVLRLNASTQSFLADLKGTPHISRDGGKGGYLNGQHIFTFCDTGSYTATTAFTNGNFLGFVSSSVATDSGMNGLYGKALHLQDGIGQWSDNAGRMRGFAPMTQGEQSYNLAMQGQGQRYAVWPEASIIPLDTESAIIYAPIVYDNVNMATKAAIFTYTGATLLTVTAGGQGGPMAERISGKIFYEDEVEWGCVGGIRSWGPSGIGGTDGRVYIFGSVTGGLLLARTDPQSVADRDSYEYWTGSGWSDMMQAPSSSAYFISGSFMDVDLFYSPRHLTFIIVYMTIYADSTFYYRYLQADQGILPPFAPRGNQSDDYVENILKYNWSKEQVLYKPSQGLSGKYVYSGGVHSGYYGTDDITNGGSKMLISWTAPTGQDPSTETSEYQIITAEIDWA